MSDESIDSRVMMLRADLLRLATEAKRIGDNRTADRLRSAANHLRPTYSRPGDFWRDDV